MQIGGGVGSVSRSVLPDGRRKISIRGGLSEELEAALDEGWCDYVFVHAGNWPDFGFLEKVADRVTGLTIASPVDSLRGIESLVNLKTLVLEDAPSPGLDFSHFQKLETCDVYWHKKYSSSLFRLPRLKCLTLRYFSGKDCKEVARSSALKELSIIQGSIQSVAGIEQLPDLEVLRLVRLTKLADLADAAALKKLKVFHLERCQKVTDVEFLKGFLCLEELHVDCGGEGFKDLGWLSRQRKLVNLLLAVPVWKLDWEVVFRLPLLQRVVINSHPGYELTDTELFDIAARYGRDLSNYSRAGTKKHPGFKFWMNPVNTDG